MTRTPEEYKGHTSDPCSPNMCGFPTLGRPGSELPGPVPTQTTLSLNTAPASATFWHFTATVEYPLASSSGAEILYTAPHATSFISSLPSTARFYQPSTVKLKRNTHVTLPCVTWAFMQEDTFIKLLNAHGDLGNQHTRTFCKASQSVLPI